MATGSSLNYVSATTHLPLPRAADRLHTPHKPWCIDCKRKHDADQLDDAGRCDRCARAVITRAAAAVRRAEREALEAARPKPAPAPTASKPTKRARRPRAPSVPRAPRPSRVIPGPALGPEVPKWIRRAASDRLDVQTIIAQYRAGDSPPTIARNHGVTPKRIYALLDHHGIERRDDRAGHSGSKPVEYPPELVAQVRRLYVDENLSRTAVAERLGFPLKRVETIMRRYGIDARPRQTGRQDGARGLKDQIAALGVTVRDIKTWALEHGLIDDASKPGIPSAHIVAAYAVATQDGVA